MAEPELGSGEYRAVGGAWIHPRAQLGDGVTVAPGAVIGADVILGAGTRIAPCAILHGPLRLGEANRIHAHVVLGDAPQDTGYRDEPTRLEIGDRNVFREGVTIHRGSVKGGGVTRIGSDNYFMANSHVGHDSEVGDRVTLANGALIAGHCRLENGVNVAGAAALAQFCTIGRLAFLGGVTGARRDLEPFMVHDYADRVGHTEPVRVNIVGLRRAGIGEESIARLRTAHRVLFRERVGLRDARATLTERGAICDEVEELLAFMERASQGRLGRQLG